MNEKNPKLTIPHLDYPIGQTVRLSKELRELAETDVKEALVVVREKESCTGCLLKTLTIACSPIFTCFPLQRADGQAVKLVAKTQNGKPE